MGLNPFDDLAFIVEDNCLSIKKYMSTGWRPARGVGSMPFNDVAYDFGNRTNYTLSNLFPIYDWDTEEEFEHLGMWIEVATSKPGH